MSVDLLKTASLVNPEGYYKQLGFESIPDFYDTPEELSNAILKIPQIDVGVNDDVYDVRIKNFRRKVDSNRKLLLVCHDYKGNYLPEDINSFNEDKIILSKNCLNEKKKNYPFTFPCFNVTDIFNYFSHHFITIPPIRWIITAHIHQTIIIGTIIFENDKHNFDSIILSDDFVVQLVRLMQHKGFDGYLINVEIKCDQEKANEIRNFIKKLKIQSKKLIGKEIILIWYDAITIEGKLDWQNEINHLNKDYFEDCGFVLVNYSWTDLNFQNTLKNVVKNRNRVFFGIDVFGRNTPSYAQGIEGIINAIDFTGHFSAGIFAPGFHHETYSCDDDYNQTELFKTWNRLSTKLSPRPITLSSPLFFGSPYTKITENDYRLQKWHVFPMMNLDTIKIEEDKMTFFDNIVYQTIFVPKKVYVNYMVNILDGAVIISTTDFTMTIRGQQNGVLLFEAQRHYDVKIICDKETSKSATVLSLKFF
uniref:Mannosyl-glycoprotein endo-beta-N-acetylglucosaminidase n=1 Tax=Panagrolaimus sp. JU765 TaxID=591449 RepID=A0AC34PWX8_9BILA